MLIIFGERSDQLCAGWMKIHVKLVVNIFTSIRFFVVVFAGRILLKGDNITLIQSATTDESVGGK